ncbi:unnamed protein product, partial [Arctogadus glacialis]
MSGCAHTATLSLRCRSARLTTLIRDPLNLEQHKSFQHRAQHTEDYRTKQLFVEGEEMEEEGVGQRRKGRGGGI